MLAPTMSQFFVFLLSTLFKAVHNSSLTSFLLCSSFQTPKEIEIIVVGVAANIFSKAVKEKNREKIKARVLDWRSRADKVIAEEEKKVRDLEVKAKDKCFIWIVS
ncbi:hypothetical protein V6N12_034906 [Hibiscus sabdariffa]|uniref:Uncharacterized protein n=1 Tax=Hibiscus sabdariffa TaxID=183260 RepID=A0ABR2BNR8_9ROSI